MTDPILVARLETIGDLGGAFAERVEPHARFHPCVPRDVALRCVDRSATFDRGDGRDLESKIDSSRKPLARLSENDCRCFDL